MDCAAKIDAQQFGGYSALAIAGDVTIKDTAYMHCESPETAIDMNNDGDHNLSVLDDASLTAKGGVYTTVCLWGEALFDTTGTVEIDNAYDSALRCKTFKVKNKEGKIILRANGEKLTDGSSALQLTDKDNYYLGKTVNMYGSSDKDADENAVTTKLGDYWAVETPSDYVFYHPYVGPNTPARTILIKGVSTQDEIDKVKDDAAQELAEQTAKLQAEIAFLQRQIIENEEATLEVKDELVNLTKSLMSLDKNPKADLAANGLVKLSWDHIPGATGYAIYVVNDNGIDELLGEVITNSFEAAPSAQYRIKAFTVLNNERVYGEAQVVKTNIKKASISSLKSTSYRKVVVKYKKITGIKTYEIKYKVSGKNWKTIKTTKLTRTIKNLTPGKRCYVKVRGVCNNGSKKIPGPWSATKSVIVSW